MNYRVLLCIAVLSSEGMSCSVSYLTPIAVHFCCWMFLGYYVVIITKLLFMVRKLNTKTIMALLFSFINGGVIVNFLCIGWHF